MPKYTVRIVETGTQIRTCIVEADDVRDAADKAISGFVVDEWGGFDRTTDITDRDVRDVVLYEPKTD